MRTKLLAINMAGVLAFALVAVLALRAQQQGGPTRTAGEQFKNIQVLKDIPANQINPSMHLLEAELGVTCGFCHVVDEWDKDDKPTKQTAREMMKMMAAINNNTFKGKQEVTCYTCHRGSPEPVSVAVLPEVDAIIPPYSPEWNPPAENLPSADQILSKYVQAIGGEQALRKVKSRVLDVERTIPTGIAGTTATPGKGQIFMKAPNLTLSVAQTDKVTIAEGFDGNKEWVQGANGNMNDAPAAEQAHAKRVADFYYNADLKQTYTKFAVKGTEKIRGRTAYVVIATPGDDPADHLYFDTQSGFLIRRISIQPTATGSLPYQEDFDDYRDTGSGVKIPFLMYMSPSTPRSGLISRTTMKVKSVQDNVPIEDAKFTRPQPPAKKPVGQ